jgi:pyridoxal/pyridoxine/pyridoxamine kinase
MSAPRNQVWFTKKKVILTFTRQTSQQLNSNVDWFLFCNNLTGDVTVAVLLDLTQGPQCNQKNAASMQSMNGILQTFQTLNSIQYLKGLKIGNKEAEWL